MLCSGSVRILHSNKIILAPIAGVVHICAANANANGSTLDDSRTHLRLFNAHVDLQPCLGLGHTAGLVDVSMAHVASTETVH